MVVAVVVVVVVVVDRRLDRLAGIQGEPTVVVFLRPKIFN